MVPKSLRIICLFSLLMLACSTGVAGTPTTTDAGKSTSPPAADRVNAALRQELDGKNVERNARLQQVVEQSPDHPQARWQLGYVADPTGWVLARDFKLTGARREAVETYRDARTHRGDSLRDHLELANLARDRGMRDEERAELTRILQLDWKNSEIRQRLGHQYIDGRWLTPEELEDARRTAAWWVVNRTRWQPTVVTLSRRLQHSARPVRESALRELAQIRDPAAIPALEAVLLRPDGRFTLTYLDWLAQCTGWQASVALARQAVLNDTIDVRLEARRRLARRPYPDFMPVLLRALVTVPEFERSVVTTSDGYFIFGHSLRWETQDQQVEKSFMVRYAPSTTTYWLSTKDSPVLTPLLQTYQSPGKELASYVVAKEHQVAQQKLVQDEVSQWQEQQQLLDDRILRCLADVSESGAPRTPQDWWDWWSRYNGIEIAKVKPKQQENYVEEWYVDGARRRQQKPTAAPVDANVVMNVGISGGSGDKSCFPAGTQVFCEGGFVPIEQVRLGDRVLSTDVETGELAFKAVFGTTLRKPVPLLELATEHGSLQCTFGHPFWVDGEGWLMARELLPGMRLHGVAGSSLVTDIHPAGREAQAYNLIVADFHTYFVEDACILSHDNTPRAPTNALVPGLMPDYASAAADVAVSSH